MLSVLILYGVAAILTARILLFVYQQSTSPLRRIPGPFWSRFTRAWYLYRVSRGHFEKENIDLHNKLGPIVRIAPDQYSCTGIEAIKKVYGLGSKFPKADWYEGWKHPDPKQFSLFSDKDIRRHAETKKLFSNLYSLSSLMSYEPFVDRCIDQFVNRLSEFAQAHQEINLGHWMQCYAFDVIGCITFGERFGFLDNGEDIEGVLHAVDSIAPFSTLSGIYFEWYPLLFKINSYLSGPGAGGRNYVAKFAKERIATQKQQFKQTEKQDEGGEKSLRGDDENQGKKSREPFITKLIRSQHQNPDKVTDYHLFMMARSNLTAGYDTTAISLSSTIYHLIKAPRVMQKLRAELDAARQAGDITDPHQMAFHETQKLPYFQAVIKEALRMHSATGLPLWRTVPEGGVELNGTYFPQGTVLGVNTWVAHYDKDVFTNPTEFYPERWIEQDEAKLKAMNDMYMPFGLGSRTCIGRHISTLEMSKLIPVLVDKFDFSMASSFPSEEADWETENFWFVKIRNFNVRVSARVG